MEAKVILNEKTGRSELHIGNKTFASKPSTRQTTGKGKNKKSTNGKVQQPAKNQIPVTHEESSTTNVLKDTFSTAVDLANSTLGKTYNKFKGLDANVILGVVIMTSVLAYGYKLSKTGFYEQKPNAETTFDTICKYAFAIFGAGFIAYGSYMGTSILTSSLKEPKHSQILSLAVCCSTFLTLLRTLKKMYK